MNDRPVLFYDSGVGGFSYLSWLAEREPHERLAYFADTAFFPYGEKKVDELQKIIIDAMGRLIEKLNPKLAVLACNTASVAALQKLRETYAIPFVGTVPAIKPAALGVSEYGNFSGQGNNPFRIGLLATSRTVEDAYTDKLIKDFASHCEIIRYGAGELVDFIEKDFLLADETARRHAVKPITDHFAREGINALVLGCTHFIFLRREFESLLGPDVMVVDSVEGVGRQIQRQINYAGRGAKKTRGGNIFLTSNGDGGGKAVIAGFAKEYGLIDGGIV